MYETEDLDAQSMSEMNKRDIIENEYKIKQNRMTIITIFAITLFLIAVSFIAQNNMREKSMQECEKKLYSKITGQELSDDFFVWRSE